MLAANQSTLSPKNKHIGARFKCEINCYAKMLSPLFFSFLSTLILIYTIIHVYPCLLNNRKKIRLFSILYDRILRKLY